MIQDFKGLEVWKKSHELTLSVYRITAAFPDHERYGLISQMRRCSFSIPTNIAEGCGRSSGADLARFLDIAAGSATELEYHLILSHDLGLLQDAVYNQFNSRVIEIQRMLAGFLRRLRRSGT